LKKTESHFIDPSILSAEEEEVNETENPKRLRRKRNERANLSDNHN